MKNLSVNLSPITKCATYNDMRSDRYKESSIEFTTISTFIEFTTISTFIKFPAFLVIINK